MAAPSIIDSPPAAAAPSDPPQHNNNLNEALDSFRLLEALRNDDRKTLQAHLSAASSSSGPLKELTSPLHLAVRCAEFATIKFLLSNKSVDANAVEVQNGNTALHLASSTNRQDVVQLFLSHRAIDDTIRNRDGNDPLDVAASIDVAKAFQVSRAELNVVFQDLLEQWEAEAPGAALDEEMKKFLRIPRIAVVDLNTRSRASGSTLLHEAVRRKDAQLIELAVRKGADVFVRNKRGKGVLDSTKDEKIKALLQQLTNTDRTITAGGHQPGARPTFRGYLGKWTNYARGYKMRWFVLENGVLSYYHTQEEEGKQSRGSLNLRFAKVRNDQADRLRFEVIVDPVASTNAVRNASGSKLYLRGSHPAERARWVQVLQQTVESFDLERVNSRSESIRSLGMTTTHTREVGAQSPQSPTATGAPFQVPSRVTTPFRHIPSPGPAFARITNSIAAVASGSSSRHSKQYQRDPPSAHPDNKSIQGDVLKTPSVMTRGSRTPSEELDDSDILAPDGGAPKGVPFQNEVPIVSNSIRTQLELAQQLVPSIGENGDAKKTLLDALQSSVALFANYETMIAERETYFTRRYEQEIQAKHLWEENIKTLAQQYAEMEAQLQEAALENARKRKALREAREGYSTSSPAMSPGIVGAVGGPVAPIRPSAQRGAINLSGPSGPAGSTPLASSHALTPSASFTEFDDPEDAEDEFFDAIESGNLPNLKVQEGVSTPPVPAPVPGKLQRQPSSRKEERVADLWPGVEPYRRLRDRIPISKDNRPSLSLWSVLKNNIGKDLTKISFPVSFNEPTSMLQRMAEDMTYASLLDTAVRQKESTLRIAFVAAFACSNYVTTLGRVAKPFNPLLGETFEYVNLGDSCKYRYQSEQVSHHPPISACIAESLEDDGVHSRPAWEFSGCVQAQSKFLGRTFEIRPTGIIHVKLSIDGKIEHYSFKKVTTSVSGFVTGSPTIDHYGEMLVKCHTTGDECVMQFKPRGWRSSAVHELKGKVTAGGPEGPLAWEIAGRWSSQMVARRASAATETAEAMDPDGTFDAVSTDPAAQSVAADLVLLWKYHPQPLGPFNLTPYASTLNDIPDGLHDHLPPTDCRMRPDLRLFERGQYDEADVMKRNLEELQRATRKKRELGEVAPHKPKFFVKTVDPLTQGDYWEPIRSGQGQVADAEDVDTPEYWMRRRQGRWDDVERIFGAYTA